jgi:DUF4097 and DUF4098 domain-containing protein YvlB
MIALCRFVLVAGGLVLIGGLLAVSPSAAQHERTVTRTVDVNAKGKVEVNAVAGRVRVTTWDRPAVEMTVRIEGASREAVETMEIQVEGDSHRVSITAAGQEAGDGSLLSMIGLGGGPSGPRTEYTLKMPATASLEVVTQAADVEVTGLQGSLTVEGSSSSVRLRDLEGAVTVATFSGGLDARNLGGRLVFATFSGDANVRLPEGAAETVLATFSGDATLTLPADAGFDLRTDFTWGGGVTSDFEIPSASGDEPAPVGGGGPKVVFESFSGDLRLRAE